MSNEKEVSINSSDGHRRLMAELFKCLANPVRLRILEKLREHPWFVCELAEEIGVDKSIISKYLYQMKQTGILDFQKHGIQVEYRLIAPCITRLADCALEEVIANQNRLLDQPINSALCEQQ